MPALKIWNGTSWDVVSGVVGPTGPTGSAGPGGGNFNLTLSGNTLGAMAQVSSGTLNLAGGNNVSLSQNANSVTIVGPNVHNVTLGGNTLGVMAQVSTGTLTLAGGNNITLSQAGNVVSVVGPTAVTLSQWSSIQSASLISLSHNGSLVMLPFVLEQNLSATEFDFWMSANGSTTVLSTATFSASAALYTLVNSTSLGLASSGSVSYTWQASNLATAASNWGGFLGLRQWSIPMNVNLTPGNYVLGFWLRSSNVGTFSVLGGASFSESGQAGVVSGSNIRMMPFFGIYSASTAALPASIAGSQISAASGHRWLDVMFRNVGV